jgi:hypothetical protein
MTALFAALACAAACDDDPSEGGQVQECRPEGACTCEAGVERATRCTCEGGSSCTVLGNDIEFACEGNAACGLDCGTDCLVSCPGTTSCTVVVGDDAVVVCPGTATCDVTCRADCAVEMSGASRAVVRCEAEAGGAVCTLTSCAIEDCGGGVYACRTSCPAPP